MGKEANREELGDIVGIFTGHGDGAVIPGVSGIDNLDIEVGIKGLAGGEVATEGRFYKGGERYILCGGGVRRDVELAKLNAKLERGRKELEKVVNMINGGRLKDVKKIERRVGEKLARTGTKRFYDVEYENGVARIVEKEEAIKLARALAGYYILRTTTQLPARQVEEEYKKLQRVERWFRDLKHVVRIRPVYHWKDRRVETHIFLCLLAQTVVAHIRKCLKACGWLDESPTHTFATFFDMLRQVTVVDIRMDSKRISLLSRQAREVAPLLKKTSGFKKFDLTHDKKRYSFHS